MNNPERNDPPGAPAPLGEPPGPSGGGSDWGDEKKVFELLASRHTAEVQERLRAGRVAVAGLGGLGSHVALALARCGVGSLYLVDHDEVDISNLHRQAYFFRHLGWPKTEALAKMIFEINPWLRVKTGRLKLTAENVKAELGGWPIVVEALDKAASKAEVAESVLTQLPETRLVCASGLAGLGRANDINTFRRSKRLFVCGDGRSEIGEGVSLMAPRVMVCAGHQANLVIRILAGLE